MTYEDAKEFIKEASKLGSVLGLDAISELMKRLDNPQDKIRIIHVAGTNGKGSTISFLSTILAAGGYKVGKYTSPSVFSYREMIQILEYGKPVVIENKNSNNGYGLSMGYISRDNVCKAIELIKQACEDMVRDGYAHPTSFEIETALAFIYMYWEQVDFLLLETGMGGRLDATNVINQPICSIITSISMDHIEYLGDSLKKIAIEKAGIMKPNAPVITCNQQPEVLNVLNKKAKELGISLFLSDSSKAQMITYDNNYTEFSYPTDNILTKYRIKLLGKYQVINAILALETANIINDMGYIIKKEAIKMGLRFAVNHGRFEQISNRPDIYIDGAHNEQAALLLRDSIEIYFTNRKLIFMIGVLADKDYKSMLDILAPLADTIITLRPNNSRALASDILADEARAYCQRVFDEKDIEHALNRAYLEADPNDVIIAFGSLSFLGSLVSILEVRKDERDD
ncbi:MAG: bifunctional folylpolyglutamate synthase/dihydrofolate synthase [Clostridiales bacterium]|jgi:dihydrofolate synthase/folylpolyglutamate synthase|nr:bifunctional folylpolyglutamate synthase/dihydrofolate synthase [Clostridiales bacterium]